MSTFWFTFWCIFYSVIAVFYLGFLLHGVKTWGTAFVRLLMAIMWPASLVMALGLLAAESHSKDEERSKSR